MEKKTPTWPESGRRLSAPDADAIATRQQALVGGQFWALLTPLSTHSDLAVSNFHLSCHSCAVACQFAPVVEGVDSRATAGNCVWAEPRSYHLERALRIRSDTDLLCYSAGARSSVARAAVCGAIGRGLGPHKVFFPTQPEATLRSSERGLLRARIHKTAPAA